MVDSIEKSGLKSITQGVSRVAKHAESIATNGVNDDEAVKDIIGVKQGEREVEAGRKIVEVSKKLDKSVLDIIG